MISLGAASSDQAHALMRRPGAFLWWYVDLVDHHGNGAVFIWSYGLPFLPGLSRVDQPVQRPAWNLAVYEGGRPSFYLLQELAPEDCSWDGEGQWVFGETRIRRRFFDGRTELVIALDAAVPGTSARLRGNLTVSGPRVQLASPTGSDHLWAPVCLGASRGHLDVACGPWTTQLSGRAYHDQNTADRPLSELGIGDWRWGRFALPDREVVVYLLEGETGEQEHLVLSVDAQGEVSQHQVKRVETRQWQPFRFGPTWPRELAIDVDGLPRLSIRMNHRIDDAPFYLRFMAELQCGLDVGPGFFEHVLPRRLDPPLLRPLIRMRLHRPHAHDSMWLPLFSGPQQGRLQRLVRPNKIHEVVA